MPRLMPFLFRVLCSVLVAGLATGTFAACSSESGEAAAQPASSESTEEAEAQGTGETTPEPPPERSAQRSKNRASQGSRLALGAAAPMTDHAMKNIDEAQVTIASVAGEHGTLVIFTCNHCPWAVAWESRITEIGNRYRGRGVGVIAINPNDPEQFPVDNFETMQERAEAAGMQFPYVVDATSDVARAYGAQKTPEAFLFNSDRELVYHGAIDDNAHEPDEVEERYLRDALDALIAGDEISTTETRAIGCSIKFRNS
ncbi:MAG: thioredoxin family protein [Myxococcota bacterium]